MTEFEIYFREVPKFCVACQTVHTKILASYSNGYGQDFWFCPDCVALFAAREEEYVRRVGEQNERD